MGTSMQGPKNGAKEEHVASQWNERICYCGYEKCN